MRVSAASKLFYFILSIEFINPRLSLILQIAHLIIRKILAD